MLLPNTLTKLMPQHVSSAKEMYNQPTEQEEDNDASPEYPLVLLRPPLHHAYCVPTYAECVCNSVQPLLGAFEHVSLLSQVAQDCSSPVQELIELFGCLVEKGVLSQHMPLTVVVASWGCAGGVGIRSVRSVGIVGLGRREG